MNRFNHLENVYVFGPGTKTQVSTPFVKDMSEVDTELIEQTPSKSVTYSKYPKGFEILAEQYADKIIYRTNYPLKEVRANEFEIQFPNR